MSACKGMPQLLLPHIITLPKSNGPRDRIVVENVLEAVDVRYSLGNLTS